jgi:hypothetical protein
MNIQPIWLKYGIYYGILSVLAALIFFYVWPIGMFTQLFITIVLLVAFMVMASKEQKAEDNGILPYGDALKTSFLTGFTGFVIALFFNLILFNLIDPGLIDVLVERNIEDTKAMMESFGMPEDKLAEAMEKAEEEVGNAYTVSKQIQGIISGAFISLIVGAITSIFTKKEETFA